MPNTWLSDRAVRTLGRSIVCSVAQSLTHSLAHSATGSIAQLLTRSVPRSLAHSLTRSISRSLALPLLLRLLLLLLLLLGVVLVLVLGLLLVPITNDGVSFSGQIIGAITIFAWVFLVSGIVWMILKVTLGIRVSEEDEYTGVDTSECGVEAYPEFVKT